MNRRACVVWSGDLQHGAGQVTTESGVLRDVPYRFAARFADELGMNPEELLGAAFASCFSMAFSDNLKRNGFIPKRLQTVATVSFEKERADWSIVRIHLDCDAIVPFAIEADVQRIALESKEVCPVSRALKTVVTLKVTHLQEPRVSA
ncbi:MAG TPA: OsmC family peroxiredoxin [Bdellovibrionales bacterium]|nr:OsmC family peroxiredoxin [Bdellovibrionales bacterium]